MDNLINFIIKYKKSLQICKTNCDSILCNIPSNKDNFHKGKIYASFDFGFIVCLLCTGNEKFPKEVEYDDIDEIDSIFEPGYIYKFHFYEYSLGVLYGTDQMYFLDSYSDRCKTEDDLAIDSRIEKTNRSSIMNLLNANLKKDIDVYSQFVSYNDYYTNLIRNDDILTDSITICKVKSDFELNHSSIIQEIIFHIINEENYIDDYDYEDHNIDIDSNIPIRIYNDDEYKIICDNYKEIELKLNILLECIDELSYYEYTDFIKNIFKEIHYILSDITCMTVKELEKEIKSHLKSLIKIVRLDYCKDTEYYNEVIISFTNKQKLVDNMLTRFNEYNKYKEEDITKVISSKISEVVSNLCDYSYIQADRLIGKHISLLDKENNKPTFLIDTL